MTISTVEELDTVPIGSLVRVNDVIWTKQESGLVNNGTTLGLQYFTGAVEEGLVSREQGLNRGDFFNHPSYPADQIGYVVIGVEGDLALIVRTSNGQFYTHTHMPISEVLALRRADPPAYLDWALRVGRLLFNNDYTTLDPLLQELRTHAYETEDKALTSLLARHGVSLETEHLSTCRITGESWFRPEPTQVQMLLGNGIQVSDVDDNLLVTWSREVPITKVGIGCQCSAVTLADVQEFLPWFFDENDEFEIECSH